MYHSTSLARDQIGIMDYKLGRKFGDSDFLDFHGQIWFGLLNLSYKFLLQSTVSLFPSLTIFLPAAIKENVTIQPFITRRFLLRRKKISFNL